MNTTSRVSSRTLGLGLLVIGAVLSIVAASVPWYLVEIKGDRQGTFNGSAVTGGVAQALSVAIIAGALLMLALRALGRRIVAVLLVVIAVIAGVTMPFQRPTHTEVITELRQHTLDSDYHLVLTGANFGYLLACLMVLAGAAIVFLRAGRWPQKADRFQRRAAAARAAVLTDDPDADIDAGAVWKSIDAGVDPTVGADEDVDATDRSARG